MSILTIEQIAEICALADAATPGPWEPMTWTQTDDVGGSAAVVPLHEGEYENLGPGEGSADECKADLDAAFIAAARTDIPALCDTVEALRAERDNLKSCWDASCAHVKEALELLGVDVSPSGFVPDTWTLREQCKRMRARKDVAYDERQQVTAVLARAAAAQPALGRERANPIAGNHRPRRQ